MEGSKNDKNMGLRSELKISWSDYMIDKRLGWVFLEDSEEYIWWSVPMSETRNWYFGERIPNYKPIVLAAQFQTVQVVVSVLKANHAIAAFTKRLRGQLVVLLLTGL